MNINLADIENRILESKDDFKNLTIIEKVFEKDTAKRGGLSSSEFGRFILHYEKNGEKYRKSFFIKVPRNEPHYEKPDSPNKFSREIYAYTMLFPLYKRLLPQGSLHPEFYGTDGRNALILEDLSHSAYKKVENSQLNVAQFAAALRKLAEFHALSLAVQMTQPHILNGLKTLPATPPFDLFSNPEKKSWTKKQFRKIVDHADATFAATHSEVMLYFEDYLQQICEDLRKSDDKLNVLNHGNLCPDNVWFAYDDLGEVVDVKFTDFQCCQWGTPIMDLMLFTVSSLPYGVFEQSFDMLLEIYSSTFNATLEKLKCDQKLSADELRGYIDSNYEYFLYFLVGIASSCEEASQGGSHKFVPRQYVDAESYDKLCKLWMSHIIKKGVFSKHEDIAIAIRTFIDTFEAENKTSISRYDLDRTVVKPGGNFCSLIVRLKFEYRKEEEPAHSSVLLKIPSLSLNFEGLKETNIYKHEIFVYQQVLPGMYRGWIGKPLAPICYTISEAKILVLEDLSVRGYRLCDKLKQLDLEHCRAALAAIATHHGISFEYLQRCDEAVRAQLVEPFNVTSTVRTLSRALYSKFLRVMKPLVDGSLHRKMEALADKIPKDAYYGRYMDDSGPNVIGHGDYWTNNILFRYHEDGRVNSVKMIDWQLSRLASPVVDLIFFFITSARFEIFETHTDALLNFYLDTFNKTLSKLNVNLAYTRSDLDEAFRRYKYYFWLYVGTELPLILGDDGCFDSEVNSDVASEYFLSVAKKWVHYLEKENLI